MLKLQSPIGHLIGVLAAAAFCLCAHSAAAAELTKLHNYDSFSSKAAFVSFEGLGSTTPTDVRIATQYESLGVSFGKTPCATNAFDKQLISPYGAEVTATGCSRDLRAIASFSSYIVKIGMLVPSKRDLALEAFVNDKSIGLLQYESVSQDGYMFVGLHSTQPFNRLAMWSPGSASVSKQAVWLDALTFEGLHCYHGVIDSSTGYCSCDSGYTGADCALATQAYMQW